jgi:hypothetical protein
VALCHLVAVEKTRRRLLDHGIMPLLLAMSMSVDVWTRRVTARVLQVSDRDGEKERDR